MKRNIFFFILILTLLFALVSCGHTHKFTGEWQSTEDGHYRVCACMEKSKVEAHIGGTATETERAVCSVCKKPYGELKAPDTSAGDKETLAVPSLTISGPVVSWSAVDGATSYLYKINGGQVLRTYSLSITLESGSSISVKAECLSGEYLDSEFSSTVTYVAPSIPTLNAPSVSISEAGVASWGAVSNATGYVCRVNGQDMPKTQNLSITLQNGDKISVKAVGDGTNYLDSAFSQIKTYEKREAKKETVDFNDMLSVNGPLTEGCLPSLGTPRVLVIPVNLDNSKKTNTLLSDINTAFTGTSQETGWESVESYYKKSSYGKLDFEFVVLNEWFTPSESKSYYESYSDNDGNDGSSLILYEALEHYDTQIDFNDYDYNDDGYIDSVWLIYNCDVDYESDFRFYWAFQNWAYSDDTYDGLYAYYYAFAGTDFMYDLPTNADDTPYDNTDIIVDAHTYIHETGHLMGLDDYYDYDDGASVGPTGGLYWADMMDYNMGDHGPINKLLLNWINPTVVSGKGEIEIEMTSFTETGFVILIANHSLSSIYDEYFLIEFYTSTGLNGNDQPIYDGDTDEVYGIRIMHVDANICYGSGGEIELNGGGYYETGFKYDNSDESKLFIDTMCNVKPSDGYATEEILYTASSGVFGVNSYSNYKYHDGTALNFTLRVLSLNQSTARVIITMK